jgi:hypothetical protein
VFLKRFLSGRANYLLPIVISIIPATIPNPYIDTYRYPVSPTATRATSAALPKAATEVANGIS